ncbi:MAG: helix-turn-helix transcriptional regulator [Chloroflexi bacterium]|nr:helix-turn-helix transcriptional regulator [Chloroflexota bacterium]
MINQQKVRFNLNMADENLILNENHPTRADALKNHTLLLETARRLFAERGVEAVPMSAVAEAARVGKGTLYRHFENKTALCQALLDEDQRDLQERTLRRLSAGGDTLANLHWFLTQVILFVDQNAALLCESAHGDQNAMLEHPAHLWWRQTIRGLLLQRRAPGDVDYTADVLYAMLDARMINFQRRFLNYSLDRIIAGLTDVLERLT